MMSEKTNLDDILGSYCAFSLMTRSAAMLGTKNSEQFDRDASALIDLIGKAYGWQREKIEYAVSLILGDMMRVGLASDYLALASSDLLDDFAKENMILYEIKGRAIEEANRSELTGTLSGQRIEFEIRNGMGYGSFHHEYEPRIRFAQIKNTAENGEPAAMLQCALMLILGIGCENDVVSAQRILQNALLWGEKSAAVILAFLWERENNAETGRFYRELFRLLDENKFIPESDEQSDAPDRAKEYRILISAVRSFIIQNCGRKDADMLFADLINRDDVGFEDKLDLIRRYKEGSWLKEWIERKDKHPVGFAYCR